MSAPQYDPGSQLLALLPEDELARLLPHLERVTLPLGKSLCESGGVMQQVYFPLTSFISLIANLSDGSGWKWQCRQ